jgi:hypothetical protein
VLAQDAVKAALPFAASEVALALQSRPPSPELEEAEKRIRQAGDGMWLHIEMDGGHCRAIASALDSLRADVKRKGEVLRELCDKGREVSLRIYAWERATEYVDAMMETINAAARAEEGKL